MQEKQGFSLVEMSVVLVVIGLIVVGVVAGSSIIYGAKLRNVIAEYDRFKQGVTVFEEQYKYYPGDFNAASQYWQDAQDGNGNWMIEGDATERLYAWNHMALANIIEGEFTGVVVEDAPIYRENVNLPGSVFAHNHYMIGSSTADDAIFGRRGAFIQYTSNDSPTSPWGGALQPKDAKYIDEKMDDGVASSGMLYSVDAIDASSGDCSASQSEVPADYNLLRTKTQCRVVLWLEEE